MPPPIPRPTGWAAPMFVPGAMAAMWAAIGDDDPGRGRPRPGRSDIDDDGDRGVQDPLGDVPHRQIQAARRIETDDQPLRTALGRFTDALDDVFGNGRGDGGADRDHVEDRRLFRRRQPARPDRTRTQAAEGRHSRPARFIVPRHASHSFHHSFPRCQPPVIPVSSSFAPGGPS